ncbi:MAG: hypothetical protein WC358_07755 [Ignavibacteria bacterium]
MVENKIIDYPGGINNLTYEIIKYLGNISSILWDLAGVFFVVLLCVLTYVYNDNKENNKEPVKNFFFNSSFFFLLVFSLGIIVLRFPTFSFPELSPDESEWISGAATLIRDGRFWHSVNGTTSGPINIFPLCLINLFSFGLNYSTVRIFCVIFIVIPTAVFLFKSLKMELSELAARTILIPVFLLFAISEHEDITAYNSEHFPMLLTILAFYFFVKAKQSSEEKTELRKIFLYNFICGIILGLLPFSKLQSIPISFVFFFIVFTNNIIYKNFAVCKNIALSLGAILPSIIVIVYIYYFDLTDAFWNYFIVSNIEYSFKGIVNSSPTWYLQNFEKIDSWIGKIFIVPHIILKSKEFILFFGTLFSISVFCFFYLLKKDVYILKNKKKYFIYLILIFLFACFGVSKPGNVFHHYCLLIVIPACLLTGFLLGLTYETVNSNKIKKYLKYYLLVYAIIPTILFVLDGNCYIKYILKTDSFNKISNTAVILKKYSRPNDRLAVWGYMNKFFVEAELIQGTREPMSYLQITNSCKQDYYINNYCKDIKENKPVLFVDAVGEKSLFYKDYSQRHENFPAIKELVNEYYEFIDSVDNVRIYKRKK